MLRLIKHLNPLRKAAVETKMSLLIINVVLTPFAATYLPFYEALPGGDVGSGGEGEREVQGEKLREKMEKDISCQSEWFREVGSL